MNRPLRLTKPPDDIAMATIGLLTQEQVGQIEDKGKTRAFVDLLATQADLQPGIRQVFSTEKARYQDKSDGESQTLGLTGI